MKQAATALRARPSWFWYTAFFSCATLPQSPLPSRPHSRLPSTKPSNFTLASLHFLYFPSFPLSLFLLSPPHLPLPLSPLLLYSHAIICSYNCFIGLYCTKSRYQALLPATTNHNPCLHSCHAWLNNNSVELPPSWLRSRTVSLHGLVSAQHQTVQNWTHF